MPEGYQLTGKTMPFWTKGKMSDAEVEDLVAYILSARQAARDGVPAVSCSQDPSPDGVATRSGTFSNTSHNVSGTVEELDTHKLRLSNFSYDGGGIEVRLWLSRSSDATSGMAVGPDLFGRELDNATLAVELPVTLVATDFDTVSIRCVVGGQDLGVASLSAVP